MKLPSDRGVFSCLLTVLTVVITGVGILVLVAILTGALARP
jgi:hypothetical protein